MALRFLNSGYFAGKVGIGTDSPGFAPSSLPDANVLLQIGGDNLGDIPEIRLAGGNGLDVSSKIVFDNDILGRGMSIFMTSDTTPFGPDGLCFFNENSTDPLTNEARVHMKINRDTGLIGIGTTNPERLLSLYSNDSETTPRLLIEQDGTGDAVMAFSLTSGQGWSMGIDNSLGDAFMIHNSAGGVDSSSQLTIATDGYVGIGTVSPETKLDVRGQLLVAGDTPDARIGSTLEVYRNGTTAELSIHQDDSTVSSGLFSQLRFRNGGNDTYLKVPQNGNGFIIDVESQANAFVIGTTGNVGINTTSPDFKLDVDGTFGVSDLPFNTDSVSVLVADETTGVEEVTNGSFTTDADWNKNPNWTISGGTANADGTSNADMNQIPVNGYPAVGEVFRVSFEVTARTQGQVRIIYGGASTAFVTVVGKYEYIITATTTDRIRIQCNGSFIGSVDNLSIKQITSASNQIQKRELGTGAFGPTPVGAYLPLTAGSGFPLTGHLFIDTPAGASQSGYALKLNKTNSSSQVQVGAEIFATPWPSNTNGGTIIFKNADSATNLQETLRISANGSVGINSTSSSYKLDVGGNARFQDSVYINTSTGAGGLYVTRLGGATESLKIYTSDSTSVFETFQDENTGEYGSMAFILDNGAPDPSYVFRYGSIVRLKIEGGTGDVILGDALLSNQENTDIDSAAAEVVAQVAHATYTAAFFDFVVKKGTNVRSGTVYACHDGDTTPLVEFTETSTNDLGNTSDVTLSVDISGTNMRLLATVTSDDWSVKSLIRAI